MHKKNLSRIRLGWLLFGLAGAGALAVLIHRLRQTDRVRVQRHFWDPVYDRLAGLYDAVDWLTFNTTHRLRQRALPYLPSAGAQLLEVGFGSGRFHLQLAESYEMAGLDLAQGMVDLTQRRLAARGLHSDLRQGSVYELPWPDVSFDAVLSTFAFSAFPDAGQALDEMIRVTKPGGRVIIVDAGHALNGNPVAGWLADLWELFGDFMRNEVPLLEARGLETTREDYGPFHSVHVTVGMKPG